MTFTRYVALGDSFTEGVGDPDPGRPNGWRGWADRFAEALAASSGPDFGYANLAIRGRKLPAIIDEQLEPALALEPDLVTIHGGANDVLRPRVDFDALAIQYDEAVERLTGSGAKVVMFTTPDPGPSAVVSLMRGRMAIFNEGVREIAERHDATIVDMWRMRGWSVAEIMDVDRLHLNPVGHQMIAIAVLDTLGLSHELKPLPPIQVPPRSPLQQRRDDVDWARSHLAPWVKRRLTGRSSGDGVTPKRPTLARID